MITNYVCFPEFCIQLQCASVCIFNVLRDIRYYVGMMSRGLAEFIIQFVCNATKTKTSALSTHKKRESKSRICNRRLQTITTTIEPSS